MTTSDQPIRAVPDSDTAPVGSTDVEALQAQVAELEKQLHKSKKTFRKDEALRPYQVELLKLQSHLEKENI